MSPWLWGGVAQAFLILLPDLIWQVRHQFIGLQFTASIHARDVAIGRSEGFLVQQLLHATNLLTLPVWVAGLYFYFFAPGGRDYRAIGWMWLVKCTLFLVSQARFYYLAAAYRMLFAGGAVAIEGWLSLISPRPARAVQGVTLAAFVLSGVAFAFGTLPVAPVNSPVWDVASSINGELKEELGWPDLVETVAGIYDSLPEAERAQTGIFTGNDGEAGALELYGPAYGLPKPICGTNSFWLRGYGDPPPATLIVLGVKLEEAQQFLEDCQVAGQTPNPYNILNEETRDHPSILVCRGVRFPWPELWPHALSFG